MCPIASDSVVYGSNSSFSSSWLDSDHLFPPPQLSFPFSVGRFCPQGCYDFNVLFLTVDSTRAWHMLGRCSTIELHPQPLQCFNELTLSSYLLLTTLSCWEHPRTVAESLHLPVPNIHGKASKSMLHCEFVLFSNVAI